MIPGYTTIHYLCFVRLVYVRACVRPFVLLRYLIVIPTFVEESSPPDSAGNLDIYHVSNKCCQLICYCCESAIANVVSSFCFAWLGHMNYCFVDICLINHVSYC